MQSVLETLGLAEENAGVFSGQWLGHGSTIEKISPIDGTKLARIRTASHEDYEQVVRRAQEAFQKWRLTPGPVRGETVRRLGNALREFKHQLGQLVTLESGKILAEGEGEVQEMIDICDLAVGQSRMLYGLTIQSERSFPSFDGAMASIRPRCCHQCVQFSSRGLVVERCPRGGVW